ncbi:MAG TPA: cupin domain-containing protein, partial [Chthoniobacterales bacterium]|nr:cupin domain-containing protein [Chthoniobacterales bacterium]
RLNASDEIGNQSRRWPDLLPVGNAAILGIIPSMNKMENPWIEIAPGIRRRTICSGANMYQMHAELKAGSRMPEHKHAQEQIAHVIRGRMNLIVAGEPHELKAGEAFYLASHVPHGVETIEDTSVIDTFSPPRDDYLALDEQARRGAG